MADTFTKWDDTGSVYTSWDDAEAGPNETKWDLQPSVIGEGVRIKWLDPGRMVRWVEPGRRIKWLSAAMIGVARSCVATWRMTTARFVGFLHTVRRRRLRISGTPCCISIES